MYGFTIFEVLLVIMLTSLLVLGCLGFFLEMFYVYHDLLQVSEVTHQLRHGLEIIIQELQDADSQTIQMLQPVEEGYQEIQFSKYDSPDLYKFYINSTNKLIRGLKRPDKSWGYTAVAEGVEAVLFVSSDFTDIPNSWIRVKVKGRFQKKYIELESNVSSGF